jgi:hypothetical protein
MEVVYPSELPLFEISVLQVGLVPPTHCLGPGLNYFEKRRKKVVTNESSAVTLVSD